MAKAKPTTLRDFDHDQATLDLYISMAQSAYEHSEQGARSLIRVEDAGYGDVCDQLRIGALVKILEDFPTNGVQRILDLVAEGYTFAADQSVWFSGTYPATMFTAHVRKPQSEQEVDLKRIADHVTELYTNERKAKYEAHVAAVAAETLRRAETASAKAAEIAKQKALESATQEALSVIGAFQ